MKELSKCCKKEKVANYSDEGTGCYLCQGCLGEFVPMETKSKCKNCFTYPCDCHGEMILGTPLPIEENSWEDNLRKEFIGEFPNGIPNDLLDFIRTQIKIAQDDLNESFKEYEKGLQKDTRTYTIAEIREEILKIKTTRMPENYNKDNLYDLAVKDFINYLDTLE